MIIDNVSISTSTTNESLRQSYQTPRLTVFGSVASLTETGSMAAMEDFYQNGNCFFENMTGNMC